MDLSFYRSYLVEEIRDEARAEGRAEGRAEDVLTVLAERGLDVSDQARDRIQGCDDPHTLSRWLRRAVTAPTAEVIFDADG